MCERVHPPADKSSIHKIFNWNNAEIIHKLDSTFRKKPIPNI